NREAGALEHQDVVRLVSNRGDLARRNAQLARQVVEDKSLVGVTVSHVEIIGLRARGGSAAPERLLHVALALAHAVKIVAHPDDLDGSRQHVVVERLHNFGAETSGAALAVDGWRLWVANQPLVASIDPAIKAVADDQVERLLGGIERQQLLLDDGQIRMHEEA